MLWTSQSVTLSLDGSGSRIHTEFAKQHFAGLEHGVTLCCCWATRYALCESRTTELAPAQLTLCPLKDWYAAYLRCPFVCRFHEVEPQKNLHMMAPPQIISQQLLKKNHTLIPYPALSEKTLVLAEHAVVGTTDTPDGQLSLMIR